MARARVSFQDWNLNWFVHLLFRVPSRCFSPAAAVCHLNNKCRWFPDLVRGAGLWCILILPHSVPRRGPSFIWIKEVEFKNAECFTWTQIASIYCAEWWNRLQFRPSPPWHRSFHHKSKKGFTFDPWRPVIFNIQKQGGISLLLSTDSSLNPRQWLLSDQTAATELKHSTHYFPRTLRVWNVCFCPGCSWKIDPERYRPNPSSVFSCFLSLVPPVHCDLSCILCRPMSVSAAATALYKSLLWQPPPLHHVSPQ